MYPQFKSCYLNIITAIITVTKLSLTSVPLIQSTQHIGNFKLQLHIK